MTFMYEKKSTHRRIQLGVHDYFYIVYDGNYVQADVL